MRRNILSTLIFAYSLTGLSLAAPQSNSPLLQISKLKEELGLLRANEPVTCSAISRELRGRTTVDSAPDIFSTVNWNKVNVSKPALQWALQYDLARKPLLQVLLSLTAYESDTQFRPYNLFEQPGAREQFEILVQGTAALKSLSVGQLTSTAFNPDYSSAFLATFTRRQKQALLNLAKLANQVVFPKGSPPAKRDNELSLAKFESSEFFKLEVDKSIAAEVDSIAEKAEHLSTLINSPATQSFCVNERNSKFATFKKSCSRESEILQTFLSFHFDSQSTQLEKMDLAGQANCSKTLETALISLFPDASLRNQLVSMASRYHVAVQSGNGSLRLQPTAATLNRLEGCLKHFPAKFVNSLPVTPVLLYAYPVDSGFLTPGTFDSNLGVLSLYLDDRIPTSYVCELVVHELAHSWQRPISSKWAKLLGYHVVKYAHNGKPTYLDDGLESAKAYGRANLHEDIANSVALSILYPKFAAQFFPERMQLLEQDYFGETVAFEPGTYRKSFAQNSVVDAVAGIKRSHTAPFSQRFVDYLVMQGPDFFSEWAPDLLFDNNRAVRNVGISILDKWKDIKSVNWLTQVLIKFPEQQTKANAAYFLTLQGANGKNALAECARHSDRVVSQLAKIALSGGLSPKN